MCKYVTVHLEDSGNYIISTHETVAPQTCPDNTGRQLNLIRLEHLAVMHTPYFVMLFLELVQNKRYTFHKNKYQRQCLTGHILDRLKRSVARTQVQHDTFRFLRLWWRFQDRVGSRCLNVPIPPYLEIGRDPRGDTWNPRMGDFKIRQPEPLYRFLMHNCIYNDLIFTPVDNTMVHSPEYPRLTVIQKDFTKMCLSVMIAKVHIENVLHCAVRAGHDRITKSQQARLSCTCSLEPVLEYVILECIVHSKRVMMHVITTPGLGWQTLDSWITAVGHSQTCGDIHKIKKITMGVLGCLRDMSG